MAASVRVILSTRATWATARDAEVTEKVRTASMMARKSRVNIEYCCGGGVVVLGPTTSVEVVVLGVKGLEVVVLENREWGSDSWSWN